MKISLSRAGIDVRGRSRRLKINYRTSEQIRTYAQGMLQGLDIDDLEGGTASIAGDHSMFKGSEPLVKRCQGAKSEAEAVFSWVQMLRESRGVATYAMSVTPFKPAIRGALTAAGILTYELKDRVEDQGEREPGVRMGSMKRIKGLEFRAVSMVSADRQDPMHDPDHADALSRCERYVAATHAREYLLDTPGCMKVAPEQR